MPEPLDRAGFCAKCWVTLIHLRFPNHSLGVVVLVGSMCFLVGTGKVSRRILGGIPLPSACRLCDPAGPRPFAWFKSRRPNALIGV